MNNMQSPQVESAAARARVGGGWFNAIALFSLVNAVLAMVGAKIHFIVGLALCEVFDVVGQGAGAAGKAIAFVADLIVAGVWALFAVQAKKGARWAFIVGMIFYTLDGLLFLAFQEWLAAAFHAYVLMRLFQGFSAAGELNKLSTQAAYAGTWNGAPSQQPGAWPPPPGQPAVPPQYGAPPNPGGFPPPAAGAYPPPAQPGQYPGYQPQPAPAQQYPPPQNLDGTPAAQSLTEWAEPAPAAAPAPAMPSQWPAPAQPAQPRPAPEAEG